MRENAEQDSAGFNAELNSDRRESILNDLLFCPFCNGNGKLIEESERCGYGEYERNLTFHVVKCKNCGSQSTRYEQKPLIDFTRYTVQDFRNNPVLRAKVEDDYAAYYDRTKQLAVEAWNKRTK
jgi:hypothetical protein